MCHAPCRALLQPHLGHHHGLPDVGRLHGRLLALHLRGPGLPLLGCAFIAIMLLSAMSLWQTGRYLSYYRKLLPSCWEHSMRYVLFAVSWVNTEQQACSLLACSDLL